MNAGLAIFIIVVSLNVGGLLLDGLLWLHGLETITGYIRMGGAWAGVAIVIVEIVAAGAISYHFFGGSANG